MPLPFAALFHPHFHRHSRYIKLWCCTKSLNHFKNWNAVNLRGKRERNIYVELWIVIFFRVQRWRRSERHSNGLLFRWNIFIGIGAFSTCISTHKFPWAPWSSLNIKLNLIWLCICRIFQNWSGLCRDNSGQKLFWKQLLRSQPASGFKRLAVQRIACLRWRRFTNPQKIFGTETQSGIIWVGTHAALNSNDSHQKTY